MTSPADDLVCRPRRVRARHHRRHPAVVTAVRAIDERRLLEAEQVLAAFLGEYPHGRSLAVLREDCHRPAVS